MKRKILYTSLAAVAALVIATFVSQKPAAQTDNPMPFLTRDSTLFDECEPV